MPVPIDTLIWYLAVFRRVFLLMEHSARSEDREQMWLCQWAAETLRNVPGMLRHYDTLPEWDQAEMYERRLRRFPELVEELGAPDSTVGTARMLVRSEQVNEELALDRNNLDLVPDGEMDRHLRLLREVCLDTRQTLPRQALEEEGWEDCEFQGRNNGRIGSAVAVVPLMLVRWHAFDPATVRSAIERAYSSLERWQSSQWGWPSPYDHLA